MRAIFNISESGEHYFVLTALNGKVLAKSDMYKRRRDAARVVAKYFNEFEIVFE